MCDLLRQAKYTIDSLEEELRLTRIGRDSCNKFLFYKEEECAALQKKLSAAEAKVERVANEICGLLEYFDCIEGGDHTEEERNFVADLTRMQKILAK